MHMTMSSLPIYSLTNVEQYHFSVTLISFYPFHFYLIAGIHGTWFLGFACAKNDFG